MPEIKKASINGGNKDFNVVKIEEVNHLFQKRKTVAMGEYISIQETFNRKALAKIGDWILERMTLVN